MFEFLVSYISILIQDKLTNIRSIDVSKGFIIDK